MRKRGHRSNAADSDPGAQMPPADDLYRDLFENAPVGIYRTTVDGTILQANAVLARLLAYPSAAALLHARRAQDFYVDPADRDVLIARAASGEVPPSEVRFKRHDGTLVWVEVTGRRVSGSDGAPLFFEVFVHDIAQRKAVEEARASAERQLRAIVETEPECVKIVAPNGSLVHMNPAGLAMLELDSVEEARRHRLIDFVAPEHRAAFADLARRVLNGGRGTLAFEVVGLRGTRRWLETHAVPLRGADGAVESLLGVTREITQHKVSQLEIGRMSRLYAALSHVNQGIVRSHSRDQLFQEVCRVLVERGGFGAAWIGWLDPPTRRVMVAAAYGDDGYLEGVEISADEGPEGQGPTGVAIREGRPYICNDFFDDPRTVPWREAAARLGWRASAAFPIHFADAVGGALSVYASDVGSFGDPEVALLTEVASDLSFGLENLAREVTRAATQRISEAANTAPDVPSLFRAVHRIVGELMPAENLYVAVTDPATGMLQFPYFSDARDAQPAPRLPGRGLTEWVLRHGRSLLANPDVFEDLVTRSEVDLLGEPSVDWVGVPLKTEGRTIGVMAVQSYTPGIRYGPSEQQILEIVAPHVAIAIERKRAQEALRGSETRFRELIERSADGIALITPAGEITYCSPTVTRILGYPVAELVGRNAFELIHPDDLAYAREQLEQVARTPGVPFIVEARLRHQNGTWRRLEATLTNLLEDPHVGAIVNNFRDMTDRRRLEEQFHQAQKMEAIGRLAGGVAHDFNNLLTVVLASCDFLLDDLVEGDRRRTEVVEIRRAGERAAALTRQLLAYSRKQVLQPAVLDLNTVVQDIEGLLRRLIGEDIALRTSLGSELGAVRADPGQLEQVIANLAVNARDAMPQGGQLTIETSNADLEESETREHSIIAQGRYVRLSVSDTGAGMDADTQAHLFEPFFTTKEVGKGTGLGLATVYGVVKQSGGHIDVASELGRGTTFTIYLPQVGGRADETVLSEAGGFQGGTETVLLVEDEPAVRALSRKILERYGYAVLVAGSGREALGVVAAHSGPIRLLITDVVMPEMSGRELARLLARSRPDLKILYVSGYTDDALVRHGVESGLPFLQKPYTGLALASKVREVLDGSSMAQ